MGRDREFGLYASRIILSPSIVYNCAMSPRVASSPLAWLLATFSLLVAGLQLLFFVPLITAGRSLDFVFFRVDALNLAFGATWMLALGLGLPALAARARLSIRLMAICSLFSLGLLVLSYAREPLLYLVAWEFVGLGPLAFPGRDGLARFLAPRSTLGTSAWIALSGSAAARPDGAVRATSWWRRYALAPSCDSSVSTNGGCASHVLAFP